MNPLEELAKSLEAQFPRLVATIDPPPKAEASWWLDLRLGEYAATAEWRPGRGFGIRSSEVDFYGEGPDEIYPDVESARRRLGELLRKRERTIPLSETMLQKIRQSRNMSQEELAERLGVQQSAVSRLERRADVRLNTLRHFVSAMGGKLELRIEFPDAVLRVPQSGSFAVKPRRRKSSTPHRRASA
jgi:DNA-binding Xre family transcriptional regulator